jgi:serine/threonine-protein kinase
MYNGTVLPDDTPRDSEDSLLQAIARAPELSPPAAGNVAGEIAKTLEPRLENAGLLGRGGMGWVHRVFDRNVGRHTALKLIDDAVASAPHASHAFLVEAQVTGQLEHPNIVPVYDLQLTDAGAPRFFTMRLVEGATLASLVDPVRAEERPGSELWDLLGVFLKVCDAVSFAHSRGVVHRDLKPDNVMVGPYGQVYVLDWGIARVLARSELHVSRDSRGKLDEPGNLVGTYVYMSPEQASGQPGQVDERTDVFALGAMLYYVLTGRPPYHGSCAQEIIQAAREVRFRPPQELVAALPPALCAIAVKAMSAAPGDRYSSVAMLRDQVEHSMRSGLALARVSFPAGAIIVREGDPPDAAYIVTRGRCEAFRGSGAERTVLRQMGPGDVFGELALLSSRPRSASVAAVEDLEAFVVTREVFEREVHADSWVVSLLRTLVSRFRELEQELEGARR